MIRIKNFKTSSFRVPRLIVHCNPPLTLPTTTPHRILSTVTSISSKQVYSCRAYSTSDPKISSPPKKNVRTDMVRWFYATDQPLLKPHIENWKPSNSAAKFTPFNEYDSEQLELAYQELQKEGASDNTKFVEVLEDQLFQVDLLKRTMKPAYWQGPIFEVRRGTWFIFDKNIPCPEPLADELEKLYNENQIKPVPQEDTKEIDANNFLPLSADIDPDELTRSVLEKPKEMNKMVALHDKEEGFYWVFPEPKSAALNLLRKWLPNSGGTKLVRGYTVKSQNNKDTQSQARSETLDAIFKNPLKSESQLTNTDINPTTTKNKREVDHLILCVHGIGQKLGQRIESVNFAQDVNVFRKLLKEVYLQNDDLKKSAKTYALARQNKSGSLTRAKLEAFFDSPQGKDENNTNHRLQAIPVIWRHNIQFGMSGNSLSREPKKEEVTLEDITVQGIQPLRSVIADVVLDVLLFYQPHYHAQIINSNIKLLNEAYREFCSRNPYFQEAPKVSIIGHSLGSAIIFDILCSPEYMSKLDFPVENFFGVGSPVGLFQLLKGNHISATPGDNALTPATKNYYNIFHPHDPVAYRIDPLVHKKATLLPPKDIPFAKGSFTSQVQASFKIISEAWNVASSLTPFDINSDKLSNEQPSKSSTGSEDPEIGDIDAEIREEVLRKLKELNINGQIDHALQIGPLDISLISALGSHIGYLASADVASFVMQSVYKT